MTQENAGASLDQETLDKLVSEHREELKDPLQVRYNWEGRKIDWFLQRLVNLANGDLRIEIGVTLTVEGRVVTGTMVSVEEYFRQFAATFSNGFSVGDEGGVLRESFESLGKLHPGSGELPSQYVHLKNAHYVVGDDFAPSGPGVLWRGKISAVSGFSLGSLQSS